MGDVFFVDGFVGGGGGDIVYGIGFFVLFVEWVVFVVGFGEIVVKGKYWNFCFYFLFLYFFLISLYWKWEYLIWSLIKFIFVIFYVNFNCVRDKYLMFKVFLFGCMIFMKLGINIFCLILFNYMYCVLKLCV